MGYECEIFHFVIDGTISIVSANRVSAEAKRFVRSFGYCGWCKEKTKDLSDQYGDGKIDKVV